MLLQSTNGGSAAHHQMQHAAAWMIMKMGDNASGPEDDYRQPLHYKPSADTDTTTTTRTTTLERNSHNHKAKVRSIAMRTEFQLGIERPRANGRSFLGNACPWHSINTAAMDDKTAPSTNTSTRLQFFSSYSHSYQLLLPTAIS